MAGVSTEQDKGGLNVDLNLVPFIDLLSTLVLFLLVTAVWLQVAAIPASVSSKGRSTTSSPDSKQLQIHLTDKGYQLTFADGKSRVLAKRQGLFDSEKLAQLLLSAKRQESSASVSADDAVEYGDVIGAIDAAKAGGISSVALSAN